MPPRRREATAFLGLGSNLGDRLAHLQDAVDLLHSRPGLRVVKLSSAYETEPVGGEHVGDEFLNLVVRVATRASPQRLLTASQAVEQALGRVRTVRWGPRTIDVDILLYDQRAVQTRRLQIPHPRLHERAFVLVPLCELAPDHPLPDGRTVAEVRDALGAAAGVEVSQLEVELPTSRNGGARA
ncbi:2-amino-4-hydroxy-6-hydroxymethyldihydropteridine diphosphokinase [Egibacter rhizosphaerae]|uniref:2-amino-4-hydroxy-6-hydroxymethyldihydropteridine diphosphokinase n=1 Tax=Egibacter rhizosphaerae TaxID=1670831 RepID=A0A411YL76_9ACTN|nr:2-amino-4-hydroxy-6-hydroxymethyldihydropteridine diphosphokinase [Egibacter rhizosphaerae]